MALTLTATAAVNSAFAYQAGSVDVSAYPKSDILISAEEAIKLIGKKGVMFVSGDDSDSYKNQHIRGSVTMGAHHLHHSDIMGNMHCAPLYQCIEEAAHHIGENGIDNDTLVIAYDDFRGPNATGVYSFFKSYGHKKVKILMGGFKAIQALDPAQKEFDSTKSAIQKAEKPIKSAEKLARYEDRLKDATGDDIAKFQKYVDKEKAELKKLGDVEAAKKKVAELESQLEAVSKKLLVTKDMDHLTVVDDHGHKKFVHKDAKKYHIDPKSVDMSAIVSKEEVKHAMDDIAKNGKKSKYMIIDARGMIEIIGERKMDNVARGGHIPGSTFLEWKHVSDTERGVAFKTAEELKKVFDQYGVTKDKIIYAYCHVGAGRGSEIVGALEIMGYKNAKVYTGSWDEWGNALSLPVRK